ncbi:MAG: hypothetical protein RL358_365 [Pseudomonadota bacterium]|jgi:hypothetical protein
MTTQAVIIEQLRKPKGRGYYPSLPLLGNRRAAYLIKPAMDLGKCALIH